MCLAAAEDPQGRHKASAIGSPPPRVRVSRRRHQTSEPVVFERGPCGTRCATQPNSAAAGLTLTHARPRPLRRSVATP